MLGSSNLIAKNTLTHFTKKHIKTHKKSKFRFRLKHTISNANVGYGVRKDTLLNAVTYQYQKLPNAKYISKKALYQLHIPMHTSPEIPNTSRLCFITLKSAANSEKRKSTTKRF